MSFLCRHGYFLSACDTCMSADSVDEFRNRYLEKDDPDLEYYYLDIDERENYSEDE